MATPPDIRTLLADPAFAAFYASADSRHPGLLRPSPWLLWVRTTENKFMHGQFDTHQAAMAVHERALSKDSTADVIVVSKRVYFGPPVEMKRYKKTVQTPFGPNTTILEKAVPTFTWGPGLEWCARCRRPSSFRMLTSSHHAIRYIIKYTGGVVTDDDNKRCCFCGIRRSTLPRDPYTLET